MIKDDGLAVCKMGPCLGELPKLVLLFWISCEAQGFEGARRIDPIFEGPIPVERPPARAHRDRGPEIAPRESNLRGARNAGRLAWFRGVGRDQM